MELVGETGVAVSLPEGRRLELGRNFCHPTADKSISRYQATLEPQRISSKKGKEVVGEVLNLKVLLEVVGRNPICVVRGGNADTGLQAKFSPTVEFPGNGEKKWLEIGDKLSLSITKPQFYMLKSEEEVSTECSSDREIGASQLVTDSTTLVKDSKFGIENKIQLSNEEGIANAVQRRQQRKLERERQEERRNTSAQRAQHSETDSPTNEEISPDRLHQRPAVADIDPVAEFGFIVEGLEFQAYKKKEHLVWDWKLEGKKDHKRCDNRDDDEEWEGDSDKEEVSKTKHSNRKMSISTRKQTQNIGDNNDVEEGYMGDRSISKATKPKRKVGTTGRRAPVLSRKKGKPMESKLESDENDDSSGSLDEFIVDDEKEIEDSGETEDEDEHEWTDEDEDNDKGKNKSQEKKPKPVCKFGSKCYRKNKEHLAQFQHP